MIDRLERAYQSAAHAVELVAERAIAVNVWWLAAGLVLHYVAQAVRTRGWYWIIHAAYPAARDLRARDVAVAYFGGAGLNAVLPARGGDVVKLALVKRKIKGGRYSTLAATFVPETLFETVAGAALVMWALSLGFLPLPAAPDELPALDVSFILEHPVLSGIGALALTLAGVVAFRWLRGHGRVLLARLRRGLVILGRPRDYLTHVATWQALARVIRLGSLACLMAAFALPVTLATVLLVMAAQGGGRIIPIAPVSAGLRLAMLSFGLVELTGHWVDTANITAFSFGVSFLQLVVGLSASAVIVLRTYGTLHPGRAVHRARTALGGAAAALPPLPRPAGD